MTDQNTFLSVKSTVCDEMWPRSIWRYANFCGDFYVIIMT